MAVHLQCVCTALEYKMPTEGDLGFESPFRILTYTNDVTNPSSTVSVSVRELSGSFRDLSWLPMLLVALAVGASAAFAPPAAAATRAHSRVHSRAANAGRRSAPALMLDPWAAYNVALTTEPLLTKSVTAAVIIGAGDAAAQQIERSRTGDKFDFARYLRWATFGLVLQGPWNHAFYSLLDAALPPTPDPFTLVTAEKVAIDQFIQA